MATTPNQRQEERYPLELSVDLHWNRQRVRLVTSDVSHRGLFLRTDTPPALRQLVKLDVELSPSETLSMHGMAVHVVQPGDKLRRDPGVGVQFYAVDREVGLRWRRFVDQVRRAAARGADDVAPPPPPPPPLQPAGARPKPPPVPAQLPRPRLPAMPHEQQPAPTRRGHPRYDAELELDLRSGMELQHLLTRDVSRGGMFIVTDAPLDPGAHLLLQVQHPTTDDRFELSAVVRRRELQPMGLGVEFTDLTHERREEFMAFIAASLPMEDVMLVGDGDPDLA